MINRINASSILPFYTNQNQQYSKYYWNAGYLIPAQRRTLIPFQIKVIGTVTAVTEFKLLPITGNAITLNNNLITLTAENGITYVTFNGGDTGADHPCGNYTVKVQLDTNTNLYSDLIRLYNFTNDVDSERWWRLSYKPSFTVLHNMRFGDVFTPHLYLEGWVDYPEIEREELIDVDQTGQQVLSSAYTKERQVLVTQALPNQLRYPLSLLRELSTGEATLANLKNNSLVFNISEPVFVFSNANNQYYTSGRLLFTAQRDFVNACGVDISGYVAFGEIEGGSIVFGEEIDGGVIFGYLES
jgi:hypothetical protein